MTDADQTRGDGPQWLSERQGLIERTVARFRRSVRELSAGITNTWDRHYLGEPIDWKAVLPAAGGPSQQDRLAKLRDAYLERERSEDWRDRLQRLGVQIDRPPVWLSIPVLARGRAGEAARAQLAQSDAVRAQDAMTREYLTADPLTKDRYQNWGKGLGANGAGATPASMVLPRIDPGDETALNCLAVKLRKLILHEAKLAVTVAMDTVLPASVKDPKLAAALEPVMAKPEIGPEIQGVRKEITEVGAFLVSVLDLKIGRGKKSMDPIKIADAAVAALDERRKRATELEQIGSALDRGSKALDQQLQETVRNAREQQAPERGRQAQGAGPAQGGSRAGAAVNEAIALSMTVAAHLKGLGESTLH